MIFFPPSPHQNIEAGRNINRLPCSATAFAIALGSPNPWLIAIATETLDFRRFDFSSNLWLLIPTFSLPYPPLRLAARASMNTKCSSTTLSPEATAFVSSVLGLAPLHLRRGQPIHSHLAMLGAQSQSSKLKSQNFSIRLRRIILSVRLWWTLLFLILHFDF